VLGFVIGQGLVFGGELVHGKWARSRRADALTLT